MVKGVPSSFGSCDIQNCRVSFASICPSCHQKPAAACEFPLAEPRNEPTAYCERINAGETQPSPLVPPLVAAAGPLATTVPLAWKRARGGNRVDGETTSTYRATRGGSANEAQRSAVRLRLAPCA